MFYVRLSPRAIENNINKKKEKDNVGSRETSLVFSKLCSLGLTILTFRGLEFFHELSAKVRGFHGAFY